MKFKQFVKEVKHQSMPYFNALKKETQEKWREEHKTLLKQEQIKSVGRAKRAAKLKAVTSANLSAKAVTKEAPKLVDIKEIVPIPAHTTRKKEFVDKIGCISYKEREGFVKVADELNLTQQQLLHMAVRMIANGEIKFKNVVELDK